MAGLQERWTIRDLAETDLINTQRLLRLGDFYRTVADTFGVEALESDVVSYVTSIVYTTDTLLDHEFELLQSAAIETMLIENLS